MSKNSDFLTRRDFLKRTLLAGGAVLAGGCIRQDDWPVRGSDKGSIRIVFYTDVHTRLEFDTPRAVDLAARAINAQKPDLVLAGGDLITDGFQSTAAVAIPRWQAYMKMHRTISGDVYPVLGNHDLVAAAPLDGSLSAKDPRAVFREYTGLSRTYYAFDALGYHFVILDSIHVSNDRFLYHGAISDVQLEWLKRDLSNITPGAPVILALHIPLLSAFYVATRGGSHPAPENRLVVNNLDVIEIIKHHNVILVLQGHLHAQEILQWRNTTFVVGGAVCARWWRGPWYGTEEGFNVLTLKGNYVEWKYVDYGWDAQRPPGE